MIRRGATGSSPSLGDEAILMILQGTQLETEYARDTMPHGVLGMNAAMMEDYLQFIANRRPTQIGLPEQYPGTTNPLQWMSEFMDPKKENFFETHVIEYQTDGGAFRGIDGTRTLRYGPTYARHGCRGRAEERSPAECGAFS